MMNQSTPVGDLLQVCVWGGGRGEGGRGGQMDVVCMVCVCVEVHLEAE